MRYPGARLVMDQAAAVVVREARKPLALGAIMAAGAGAAQRPVPTALKGSLSSLGYQPLPGTSRSSSLKLTNP